MTIRTFGWLPDHPDQRDFVFLSSVKAKIAAPPLVDLRGGCPSVYDQGSIGSCTAQAICAMVDFVRKKKKKPFITPSTLFLYYNERVMERTVNSDSGAMIRDGIKSVAKQGVPPSVEWPYDELNVFKRPKKSAYDKALLFQTLSYLRVNSRSLTQLRGCLAEGFPFVFGATLYEKFETSKKGVIAMPGEHEDMIGGHAMLCVGYDDSRKVFIVRNSWGNKWGDKGYCYMPYDYLTNTSLSDDFWTIRDVE